MDPQVRLNMYLKMGFEIVPVQYVQPPLTEGKDFERNLLLLHIGDKLTKDVLSEFLFYFYKYLGYEDSHELISVINSYSE